jgi:putative phosphoesterase
MVLDFPIMAEYAILAEGKQMIFATHGHKWNEKNLPALRAGDILLHGHTHIPVCKEEKGVIVMNPGSLTLPKEKSHHGYMTLENGTFLWKDLNGNLLNRYQMK